jgi:predicted Zn-dependent protease
MKAMKDEPSRQSRAALTELEDYLKRFQESSISRRGFLAAVPLLLSACATTVDGDRRREGDNTGQDTELTVDDERRLTNEALVEMRKDYPPLRDAEAQSYITQLGRKITTANRLEGNPYSYSFTVVDKDQINAFALPAGTIFVTAPLLALADSEAELAGVIGHEIGHVKARHAAERMEKQKRDSGRNLLWTVGGGLLGAAAGYGLGSAVCSKQDRECMARMVQLGGLAGAAGTLLIQKYRFMANSREDELEADRVGFRTSVQAGFNPSQVGAFYAKLLKMEEQSKGGQQGGVLAGFADALSTHPPSRERVAQMQEMAQAESGRSGVVSSPAFERIRGRLKEKAVKG